MTSRLAPAWLAVSLSALAACSSAQEPTGTSESGLASPTTIKCSNLTLTSGRIGSGQSAAALAVRDQSGSKDAWSRYVEFSPRASATCTFALPSGTDPSQVTSLALETNYRGPKLGEMKWVFEVFDPASQAWRGVGDNGFAANWTWSAHTFALAPAGLFSNGALQIRYRTDSSADASQLDELVVLATMGGAGSSAPVPSSTDPAPAPRPRPRPRRATRARLRPRRRRRRARLGRRSPARPGSGRSPERSTPR